MDPDASIPEPAPSVFNYVLSFLLVGVAWGFTTPFIRRAAADFNARQEKQAAGAATRGRSHSSTHPSSDSVEEEQELLPQDQDESVRRRSGSRQRVDDSAAHGAANEGDEDDIPAPAWKRESGGQSWVRTKIVSVFWTVVNLLRTPAYAVPLVINLTGSVWFFLLVGKHGMYLHLALVERPRILARDEGDADGVRTLPDCTAGQFECVPVHRAGRVVRGAQGHRKGNLARHVLGSRRNWTMRAFEEPNWLERDVSYICTTGKMDTARRIGTNNQIHWSIPTP